MPALPVSARGASEHWIVNDFTLLEPRRCVNVQIIGAISLKSAPVDAKNNEVVRHFTVRRAQWILETKGYETGDRTPGAS